MNWTNNFQSKITAAPTTYGLTAGMATAYTALNTAFITAYNAAQNPLTRSPVNIIAKDTAKRNLITIARSLARTVQGTASVTAAQKEDLGLNPRSNLPSPIPPPDEAPDIDIISTVGNTVRIRLHEAGEPTRRGKPAGVAGAAVFSHVGATAPTEEADWKFEGLTTKTVMDINFPSATAPGSKVWISAFWRNPRDQNGPAATPVTTNIPGGSAMAA